MRLKYAILYLPLAATTNSISVLDGGAVRAKQFVFDESESAMVSKLYQ